MATNVFQKSLSEYSAPGIGSIGGGRSSASTQSPNLAVAAMNIAANVAPLVINQMEKSNITELNKNVSQELFKIYEAKNQGLLPPIQAETQLRNKVLEFKKNNPEYLGEIDAVVKSTLGYNPIQSEMSAQGKQNIAAQTLGYGLFPTGKDAEGNPVTPEMAMEAGFEMQAKARRANAAVKALQINKSNKEAAQIQLTNKLGTQFVNQAIDNAFRNLTIDIGKVSSSINDPDSLQQYSSLLKRYEDLINNMGSNIQGQVTDVLANNPDLYGMFDQQTIVKNVMAQFDSTTKRFFEVIKNSRENGTLKQVTDASDLLSKTLDIEIQQSMPVAYMLSKLSKYEGMKHFLTPEFLGGMTGPQLRKELTTAVGKTLFNESPENVEPQKETLKNVIDILGGDQTLEDLKDLSVEDKQGLIKAMGGFVSDALANHTTFQMGPRQDLDMQEGSVFNAMNQLFEVVGQSNITRSKSIANVADQIDNNFIQFIKKAGDQSKADQTADKAVNVLHKHYRMHMADVDSFNISPSLTTKGTDQTFVAFNTATGKYQLRELTIADLDKNNTAEMGAFRRAKQQGLTGSDAIYKAKGISQKFHNAQANTANGIIDKLWNLKQYQKSIGKFSSKAEFADGLNQSNLNLNIPYTTGSKPNKNNLSLLLSMSDAENFKAEQKKNEDLLVSIGKRISGYERRLRFGQPEDQTTMSPNDVTVGGELSPASDAGIPNTTPSNTMGGDIDPGVLPDETTMDAGDEVDPSNPEIQNIFKENPQQDEKSFRARVQETFGNMSDDFMTILFDKATNLFQGTSEKIKRIQPVSSITKKFTDAAKDRDISINENQLKLLSAAIEKAESGGEGDNARTVKNPTSSATGFFQITNATRKSASQSIINRFTNSGNKEDIPEWVIDANKSKSIDDHVSFIGNLTREQQEELFFANLFEKPGSDKIFKRIVASNFEDDNALADLYMKIHHTEPSNKLKQHFLVALRQVKRDL